MRWRRRRREVYGDGPAGRVVAVTTATRAARQGVLWGLVFGGTIAASAATYASVFPTDASREQLARSFEGNTAWAALFGPLRQLDTVAGYTVYKSGMTVIILGAIWGLLLATKSLRGEEDAGRWELFLSGRTTRARAAVQAVIGLGVGLAAAWVLTFVFTAGAGARADVNIGVGASAFFVTALLSAAAMFMAIGVFLGELAATRRDANLIGGAVLAGSYLVRMVADSDPGLASLRWASPLGWIEELRPLTGSEPLAFALIALLVVGLVVAALRIAAERDLGASVLASRDRQRPRTLLLGGQAGLTIRLTRGAVIAWTAAMIVTGLVFGLVAQAAGSALRGAQGIEEAIRRLGGSSSGAASYLGFVFVVAAGLMAIAVATQVASTRNEEAAGHLDNLIVRPVARWRWLIVRLGVAAALVVVASFLAGIAAWIGAVSQHADVGFGEMVKAGLNVVPPAVFVLGVGALAFGVLPRAAIAITYGLVVWSFLVETIAAAFDSNHWLRDLSPLLHVAPVPAADPNVTAALVLVALGLLAAFLGLTAFGRRDVAQA
ncbi:MAG TPA: ABC transporter permease subunit [Actinomycetota bacterium]|nr:ABC transporter permease subunit [Actinomycetota bacterium]